MDQKQELNANIEAAFARHTAQVQRDSQKHWH